MKKKVLHKKSQIQYFPMGLPQQMGSWRNGAADNKRCLDLSAAGLALHLGLKGFDNSLSCKYCFQQALGTCFTPLHNVLFGQ